MLKYYFGIHSTVKSNRHLAEIIHLCNYYNSLILTHYILLSVSIIMRQGGVKNQH